MRERVEWGVLFPLVITDFDLIFATINRDVHNRKV